MKQDRSATTENIQTHRRAESIAEKTTRKCEDEMQIEEHENNEQKQLGEQENKCVDDDDGKTQVAIARFRETLTVDALALSADAVLLRLRMPRLDSVGYSHLRWRRAHWLQQLSLLPGGGGPQAILRPRQKRQARGGFLSLMPAARLLYGSGLSRMPRLDARGEGDPRNGDQLRDFVLRLALGECEWR